LDLIFYGKIHELSPQVVDRGWELVHGGPNARALRQLIGAPAPSRYGPWELVVVEGTWIGDVGDPYR
jgi:hypothetical protein